MLFDVTAALEVTAGSQELLFEILGMFESQVREDLAVLKAALASGDVAKVRDISHRIKGTCGGVAAEELRHWAALIEAESKTGVLQNVDAYLAKMDDCFSATVREMSMWRSNVAPK